MSMSPTQRTLREQRNQGRRCAIVEKWNAYAGKCGLHFDMFGIIDVIALDPERGVIGVQSCGNSFAAHYRKITIEKYQETLDWLQTPGTALELWAWRKVKKKRGGKQMVWRPRIKEITLEDLK